MKSKWSSKKALMIQRGYQKIQNCCSTIEEFNSSKLVSRTWIQLAEMKKNEMRIIEQMKKFNESQDENIN
jgi:hypothetical protein